MNRDVAALSGVFSHWVENDKGAAHPLADLEALDVADDETIRYLTPAEDSARCVKRSQIATRGSSKARRSANEWRAARGYEPAARHRRQRRPHHADGAAVAQHRAASRRAVLARLGAASTSSARRSPSSPSHSKGNTTRTMPLNAEALAVLAAIKPEKATGLVFKSPVTGGRFNNVKKAWAEITKAAGLPDLRWHDLRHDFASQLVMRGVPALHRAEAARPLESADDAALREAGARHAGRCCESARLAPSVSRKLEPATQQHAGADTYKHVNFFKTMFGGRPTGCRRWERRPEKWPAGVCGGLRG